MQIVIFLLRNRQTLPISYFSSNFSNLEMKNPTTSKSKSNFPNVLSIYLINDNISHICDLAAQ